MNRILAAALMWVMIASSAHAISVVPTGLNPGTQYRLAFVTSTKRDATSANIADYNAFVTGVANTVPELLALGTTWKVIGSTTTVAARDNTGTNPSSTGVPIYLLNNTKMADSNADLWDGTIDNPLGIDQNGSTVGSIFVWTGSVPAGTGAVGNTLGGASGSCVGDSTNVSTGWIQIGCGNSSLLFSFYALSDQLIVAPVPMPGAALLFGSALCLLGATRKRNRRSATV